MTPQTAVQRGRPGRRRRRPLPAPVGLTQQAKARLQGRRGAGPLQPYRELRRLWGKSGVDVEGTTLVYRLAPVLVAAAMGAAILLVPVAGAAPGLGVGHDALALAGPARARAARGLRGGLGHLQRLRAPGSEPRPDAVRLRRGGARALAAVAALVAGTTDLRGIIAGTGGRAPVDDAGARRSPPSPSRSSSSPRRAGSRSTTPTRTSS